LKIPTVYDVAERAQVSIASVSRVLRSPESVRDETRERVLEAVRFLGYVPSANARGLAARRTNVIGLFFPGHDDVDGPAGEYPGATDDVPIVVDDGVAEVEVENLYFDEVLRGAEIEAWRRGFALMVAAGRGASREALVNDIAGRVDGLAVLARTVPDELLAHVARRIPVVVLAGSERVDEFDHVSASNRAGMRALAGHVFERHAPAATLYVTGPGDSPDAVERLQGFEDAVASSGVEGVEVIDGDFTRERGRAVAAELCGRDGFDTRRSFLAALLNQRGSAELGFDGLNQRGKAAIVCANDQMALGVLDVLGEKGIRVPEDVVVTGFDGISAGRHSKPRLTTVHQPMVELGRAAVHAITARLDDPELAPQSLTLPVQVVLRESCP
jgi:LacI family transcriptional regulator